MQRPPRRPIRKPPPAQVPADASSAASDAAQDREESAVDRRRLIDEFDAALRDDASLTASDREIILRNYENALTATPVQLGPPNLKDLQADFTETVNRLAEMDVIDRSESSQLIRDLTNALRPIDDVQVQISEEYMQRVRDDGIDAAAAWLKNRTAPSGSPSATVPGASLRDAPAARGPRRRKR